MRGQILYIEGSKLKSLFSHKPNFDDIANVLKAFSQNEKGKIQKLTNLILVSKKARNKLPGLLENQLLFKGGQLCRIDSRLHDIVFQSRAPLSRQLGVHLQNSGRAGNAT
mgnify:CR=1 FL=1